jgi:hypothetical protein
MSKRSLSISESITELKLTVRAMHITSTVVRADDGNETFNGFYGDYKLIVYAGDKTISVDYRLSKNIKTILQLKSKKRSGELCLSIPVLILHNCALQICGLSI